MKKIEWKKLNLSWSQKTGFILLFVFTILTVSLGFLQMRNNIYNPLAVNLEAPKSISYVDENTRLQGIDTDQDGLNDYEELYFYETSAYLPDTDSDGVSDKTEIEKGTDPNCAEGKMCESFENIQNTSTTLGNISAPENQGSEPTLEELQAIITDPQKIRELLLKTGKISEDQLKNIDDATLLKTINSMMSEQNSNAP